MLRFFICLICYSPGVSTSNRVATLPVESGKEKINKSEEQKTTAYKPYPIIFPGLKKNILMLDDIRQVAATDIYSYKATEEGVPETCSKIVRPITTWTSTKWLVALSRLKKIRSFVF